MPGTPDLSGSPALPKSIREVPVYRAPGLEQYGLTGKAELPGTPDLSGSPALPKSIPGGAGLPGPELEQ